MARISGDAFARVVPDLAVNGLTLVDGPVGSGKTAELVRRAAQAANEGRDVLVVCATRVAADDFARRVDKRARRQGSDGRFQCTTPWELARGILAEVDAKRVLLPHEAALMLGDLDRLAIRHERLQQMFKFFERSWADLADWNPSWLVTYEERALNDAIGAWQEQMGGRLAARVVPDALELLRKDAGLRARVQHSTVMIDDAELFTRAEQVLAVTCCTDELVVASDRGGACALLNDYACAAGVDELAGQNPGACRVGLAAIGGAASPVPGAGDGAARDAYTRDRTSPGLLDAARAGGQVFDKGLVRTFKTPAEEFDAAARTVRQWLELGIAPRDILVVAQHPTWRANLEIALRAVGAPVSVLPEVGMGIPGSQAYEERVRALSMLRLLGNPEDGAARRAGVRLPEGFAQDLVGDDVLRAIADQAAGERPAARLATFLRQACAPSEGAHVRELTSNLDENARLARFGDGGAVRICEARQAWGLEPEACLVAGCMEGFLPSGPVLEATLLPANIRERIFRAEMRAVSALKSHSARFACSATSEVPLELAEKLGLEVCRIVARGPRKVALLRATSF